MKNILLIILAVFAVQGFSQKQIKTVTEIKYNGDDLPVHKTVKEFNEDSVMIKNTYYNGNFELVTTTVYSPIVNQQSTEIIYDKKGEVQEMDTIKYDKDGEIIYYSRKHPQRPNGSNFYVDIYRFEYDKNHNIIKEYREENGFKGGWVYDYEYNDLNQKIIMKSTYNDIPREEYTFEYEEGNLVAKKLYDYNNAELTKQDNTYWYYEYKKGRRISRKTHSVAAYLVHPIVNFETYKYNGKGFVKETKMYKDDKYEGKRVYDYTYH